MSAPNHRSRIISFSYAGSTLGLTLRQNRLQPCPTTGFWNGPRKREASFHSPANRCSQAKISFSLSQAALPVQLGPIVSVSTSRKSPLGLPNALLLIVREPTAAIHPSAVSF